LTTDPIPDSMLIIEVLLDGQERVLQSRCQLVTVVFLQTGQAPQ